VSTSGAGGEQPHEPVDVDDLVDDPRTDIEALALGALLWAPAAEARRVTGVLTGADFARPMYAELYEAITAQVDADVPHDPASTAAYLTQVGKAAGHRGALLHRALTQATLSGAAAEFAGHTPAPSSGRPTGAATTPPPLPSPKPPRNCPSTNCSNTW